MESAGTKESGRYNKEYLAKETYEFLWKWEERSQKSSRYALTVLQNRNRKDSFPTTQGKETSLRLVYRSPKDLYSLTDFKHTTHI